MTSPRIVVVDGVQCPKCGAGEMHPDGDKLLVRAFKVEDQGHWWSQCLVCSGYYEKRRIHDAAGKRVEYELTPGRHDPKRGWF